MVKPTKAPSGGFNKGMDDNALLDYRTALLAKRLLLISNIWG